MKSMFACDGRWVTPGGSMPRMPAVSMCPTIIEVIAAPMNSA